MLTINGADELKALVGKELGVSGWLTVEQADVDAFAATTHDEYWIHTDLARAKTESPFGGTIVHGLFTLSLGAGFSYEIYEVKGFPVGVNYGYQRVRFPAPVPVGSRIRMRAILDSVEEVSGGIQYTVSQIFEREGSEKPVCAAEWLCRLFNAEHG
jgi:acyl dehydratase